MKNYFSEFSIRYLSFAVKISFFTIIMLLVSFLIYHCLMHEQRVKQEYFSTTQNNLIRDVNKILDQSLSRLSTSRKDFKGKFIIEDYVLQICKDTNNCIKHDLLRFGEILSYKIPYYMDYKILLNDDLFYTNAHQGIYEQKKYYSINENNLLSISLSLDKNFWFAKQREIRWTYWFIVIILAIMMGVGWFFHKLFFTIFVSEYDQKNRKELEERELKLVKRIWNIDYTNKKDIEINLLFSKHANLIISKKNQNLPCSIIFQSEEKTKDQKISLSKLVKLFRARFCDQEEDINISIKNHKEYIYFNSEILLYQIIYSILNYLIFAISFYNIGKCDLCLNIADGDKILSFEVIGNLSKKYDLKSLNKDFICSHANLFIINLSQLSLVLDRSGYTAEFNDLARVDIFKKNKNRFATKDNVVMIDSMRKR